MKYDFNAFLARLGKDKPISSFKQLVESGQFVKEVKPSSRTNPTDLIQA